MSQVLALADIRPELANQRNEKKADSPKSVSTEFFKATADTPQAPTAILVRYPAGESLYSSAHYHEADQFQIIMEGEGTFGRHHVAPYCVHFTRAYTRYGPLHANPDTGWAFMVMRTRYDPGSQRALDKLKQIPGRRPWQITTRVGFPRPGPGVAMQPIPELHDDDGLFVSTMTMAPNTSMMTPDASHGDGQYVLVVKGGVILDGNEKQAPVVVYIKPDEAAIRIDAGAHGLEAMILNFPRVGPRAARPLAPAAASGLRKWQCELCAFFYDEALGMPEEGIAPGTRWQDVPETWSCPDCAASKSDFRMIAV
jgi:rubredoxin